MYYQDYYKRAGEVLDAIFSEETAAIEAAGRILYETLKQDGMLYAFGSGHSHMMAEELFYRAGGLAAVCPIFDTAAMLHESAAKSSQIERMSGYAAPLLSRYPIGPKDCLLVFSNSGINPLPIELAECAKAKGAKTICITSLVNRTSPSRHPEGKRLSEVCDVCIDSHVPKGDALVQVCADGTKAGPVSSLAGSPSSIPSSCTPVSC